MKPTTVHHVRPPAVAGSFYPASPNQLRQSVQTLLDHAGKSAMSAPPLALIAPHAGYRFSGHVAAESFALVKDMPVQRVVILGVSHRYPIGEHVALSDVDAFATPLGICPVDTGVQTKLMQIDPRLFRPIPAAHAMEHSIEVELPFLQIVLSDSVPIVPLLVNDAAVASDVAQALHQLDLTETLIVASSDFSHFPTYDDAVRLDTDSLAMIETGQPEELIDFNQRRTVKQVSNLYTCMCGEAAIAATMHYAKLKQADQIQVLEYANSGDVAPAHRTEVVGYGAVGFFDVSPAGKGNRKGVDN